MSVHYKERVDIIKDTSTVLSNWSDINNISIIYKLYTKCALTIMNR